MSQTSSNVQPEHPHVPEQGSRVFRAAVTASFGDQYEVIDVLAEDEDAALLCRDIRKDRLAIVKKQPNRKDGEDFSVSALYELDASVPAPPIRCQLCSAITEVWVAPCGNCGASISGIPAGTQAGHTREELFYQAKKLAAGQYELVGDMEVGRNAGMAYFGWRLSDGRLAALRLERLASSAHSDSHDLPIFVLHSSVYRHLGHRGATQAGVVNTESATKECPHCGSFYDNNLKFCPTDGAALRLRAGGAGDLIGEVIADRYLILRKIDEGGMGHVYLAEHIRMKRKSAVKVMNPRIAFDTAAIQRFVREAESASRVVHPNVATIFDFGETKDGLIYLAMEYVEGETLQRLIEATGAVPLARAAEILRQVADGLSEAHELGIIHRDLKPRNIMIAKARDGSDLAKIVDFGIAKAVDHDDSQITVFGSVVGTPDYMSPEQLGGSKIDARSDIYSLGLIVYNMLTGLMPFPRATSKEALISRLMDRPKALALVRPEVEWAPRLQGVLDKALAAEPESRYATARQFAAAFGEAAGLAGASPSLTSEDTLGKIAHSMPRPGSLPQQSDASGSAKRRNRILAAVAGVLVLAIGAELTLSNAHESPTPPPVAKTRSESTVAPSTRRETTSAAGSVIPSGAPAPPAAVQAPAPPAPVHALVPARGSDSAGSATPAKVRRPEKKPAEAKETLNAEEAALETDFDETRAQILKARLAWKNDGDYEKALPILKYLQKRLADLAAEHPRVVQIDAFRHEVDDLTKQVRTGCEAIAVDPEACK
jgi:serine/threonine-protein kinase